MTRPRRVASLDVFRGLTVVAMIVVNNPGNWLAVPAQLQHAAWNGCTLADLVFAFFIVIVGMSLAQRVTPDTRAERATSVPARILWRTLTLLALGLLLNAAAGWPHLAGLRIPGVLQRIALTYACAALALVYLGTERGLVLAAVLLLVHWALLVLVPFGGAPAAMPTPAHNLAAFIDRALFGRHLLTPAGDPEGLLGVLPSIATALCGAMVGTRLRRAAGVPLVRQLVAIGVTATAIGVGWSYVWPMNKALWSGSYALFGLGTATLAFSVCYVLVDLPSTLPRWVKPLEWLGQHALAIYVGSEFLTHALDYPWIARGTATVSVKDTIFWRELAPMVGDAGAVRSSVIYAAVYALCWITVATLFQLRQQATKPV